MIQGRSRQRTSFTDEPNQDVLRTEAIVLENAGLFLGQLKNKPGSIRKAIKHSATLLATA
jgi:hypothetical protein